MWGLTTPTTDPLTCMIRNFNYPFIFGIINSLVAPPRFPFLTFNIDRSSNMYMYTMYMYFHYLCFLIKNHPRPLSFLDTLHHKHVVWITAIQYHRLYFTSNIFTSKRCVYVFVTLALANISQVVMALGLGICSFRVYS